LDSGVIMCNVMWFMYWYTKWLYSCESSQHTYASVLTETVSHTKYSAASKWLYDRL